MQPNELELNYKYPVVASDGNTIIISENGPSTIVFFQVRKQSPSTVEADVVAAVRLHSIDELKQLQKAIEETVQKHETREK